ncbi:MAG: inorganic pyrophosphatase, partial [Methanosaeta sp. SDB]
MPAAAGVINSETKFVLEHFGVPVPETITDGKGKKIILVDHNEVAQAVDNIKEATLMEVVDHHKIGDIQTGSPIFFHNEPVGSTATIISAMYDQCNVPITKEMAGVMISAILSDTVLFKSPTCTEKDKAEVEKLAKIIGEDYEQYGIAMLTAKSDISSKTAMDIVKGDYKHFDFAGTKAGVGQIEVMDLSVLEPRRKEILETMETVRKDEGLSFVLIMLTDVMKEASDLLFVG